MKYLILAGGSGTRLWPLSRKNFPKQFISIFDENTLLQNTILRVSKNSGLDTFIITNEASKDIVKIQLKKIFSEFREDNIITEPVGKNTLPAIAYSTLFFHPEEIIAVLSADHYIKENKKFNDLLSYAETLAKMDYFITLGILPTSPKTGYGYIKRTDKQIKDAYIVEKFIEKPPFEDAVKFLKEGKYFWNAGIFVFKISLFLQELRKHQPDIYNTLEKIKQKKDKNEKITYNEYNEFKSISIDYGIMEKTDRILVIPADIGWSDIGSFASIFELSNKDNENNLIKVSKNGFVNEGSKNVFVIGKNRIIATIDLDNILIVDTGDALLVSNLKSTEKVKNVYEKLSQTNSHICEEGTELEYSWGKVVFIFKEEYFSIKRVEVVSNEKFEYKSENLCKKIIILKGEAIFYLEDGDLLKLKEKESFDFSFSKFSIEKLSDRLIFLEINFYF